MNWKHNWNTQMSVESLKMFLSFKLLSKEFDLKISALYRVLRFDIILIPNILNELSTTYVKPFNYELIIG